MNKSSLANNYKRRNLSFKKGIGSFLYSSKGEKYLDFVQGIAVNSLGHANPYLYRKLKNQAKKLWHVSNAFIIPEGENLAKRLTKNTFADAVIFQNSGAEATEVAIKVARRYFYSIGKPNKNRILCIKNSFHGRTIAAINASGSKKMTEGFGPKVPGFDHFEFGNHKKMQKLIKRNEEPITPFIELVRDLYHGKNISTIIVMGSLGKYFDVSEKIIRMKNFKPIDVTKQARKISGKLPIKKMSNAAEQNFNFGDHKQLKKLITKKTAAIMVETIMGEGGIKTIPDWCIKELR